LLAHQMDKVELSRDIYFEKSETIASLPGFGMAPVGRLS
jgi:hypothetical protein